jgi:hypothetical protein
MTREEVERERQRALDSCRLTYDELKERAEDYSLSEREMAVLRTVEGYDFLLEGDDG